MDKLNITPTPWQLSTIPIELMTTDSAASIWSPPSFNGGASLIADISRSAGDKESLSNAEAIVKAVNGTYGVGIDPDSVKGLYDVLLAIFNSPRGIGLSVELVIKMFESLDKATPGILTNP